MHRRPRSWFLRSSLASVLLAAAAVGFAACTVPAGDALTIPDCIKAEGICVPEGDCATNGGTVPGTSDCHSDDGPSECCLGKKATAGATTCEAQGGVCLPGADCAPGRGYYSLQDLDCGAANYGCCIPHALCGDQSFDCCGEGAGVAYHPARCDNGALVCEPGFDKALLGSCNPTFHAGM
jgi:hypothetical protein